MNATSLPIGAEEILEPIRNPEQFLAAVDASWAALADAMRARNEGAADVDALADRAHRLSVVVGDSPFAMRDGVVIAKGFTPRIVRAD